MLKLDLQMFSEEAKPGTDSSMETTENQSMTDSEQFEDLYYNGAAADEEEAGDDTVNTDSDEVAGGDTDQTDGSDQQTQNQQQQPWKNSQNAQFAAERRRQEEARRQQAAVDAAYARIYAGQTNPYTGKPIQTEADYNAYIQQHTMEQLKQSNVDPNMFQQVVNNDPRVQRANVIIQQQQQMQAQMQQQQQIQQLNTSLDSIKKFDKDVKTFDDIVQNPHFSEIEAMWKKGYSLEDAYFLANRNELEQKKQAAARQQVINQTTGKKHLKSTGQNGAGNDVHIPADELAMYRAMNPGVSDDAIRKHYARVHKK